MIQIRLKRAFETRLRVNLEFSYFRAAANRAASRSNLNIVALLTLSQRNIVLF